jgi:hypothetical protein
LPRLSYFPREGAGGGFHWVQLYVGLFFTTLGTLILELALTRIFSVVFFYHFAFLAISIALFGLGAGGVFSYVVGGWRGELYRHLGSLAVIASFSVVAALWFLLSQTGEPGAWALAGIYLASAIPFFLSGAVVSLAISEAIGRVGRAYFFDLTGASAGCLLLIPFLKGFGGPNTLIAAAAIYGIAAAIWFNRAGAARSRVAAVLLALLLVGLMVVNGRTHLLDIRTAKGRPLPPERFTAWNAISRIGVARVQVSWEPRAAWNIIIDADAGTGIAPFDWERGLTDQERAELLGQGPGFAFALRPAAKALIIGPGGGYDVARALASGSRDITAVEINPLIADTVMRRVMLEESHRIYLRPEVRVFVEDGRSFVRRTDERYQVLQATLVDTWASTAAGAFALSENTLYTTEAFVDYLSRLTEDGVLTFTRWGFDPPRESLRLVSLAIEALDRAGQRDPWRHVMILREDSARVTEYGALDTVLVSRQPFTDSDIGRARELLSGGPVKLEALYLPGDQPSNAFSQMLSASDRRSFWESYPYAVSPVSDDRPFFFYTVQPREVWDFLRSARPEAADYKLNRAVPLLFGVLAISIIATALVLALPRALLGIRLPKQPGVVGFLWYFVCLGAGYILIQVALMQKFVLLLGSPTYALTVIVFSMLLASGLGSLCSRSTVAGDDHRLVRVLIGVAIVTGGLAFAAPGVIGIAAPWPITAKILLSVSTIAPAAFLMGMPFPAGLSRLEQRHPPSVRWAWSINAAASVLGSAAAVFLAIYFGLRATMLIGGALYLVAMGVIWATRIPRRPSAGAAR